MVVVATPSLVSWECLEMAPGAMKGLLKRGRFVVETEGITVM